MVSIVSGLKLRCAFVQDSCFSYVVLEQISVISSCEILCCVTRNCSGEGPEQRRGVSCEGVFVSKAVAIVASLKLLVVESDDFS